MGILTHECKGIKNDKIKEDIIKKTLKNGDEAGDNEVDDGSKVETDK